MKVVTGGAFNYLPTFCPDGENILVVHTTTRDLGLS